MPLAQATGKVALLGVLHPASIYYLLALFLAKAFYRLTLSHWKTSTTETGQECNQKSHGGRGRRKLAKDFLSQKVSDNLLTFL